MLPTLKYTESLKNLEKALDRLGEMVIKSPDPERIYIDATIQRFEFSIELFWKVLKLKLALLGKEVTFPKETLQQAYFGKMINNEELWLNMMKDRNKSSHIYSEKEATEIYERIKLYYTEMRKTFENLKKDIL